MAQENINMDFYSRAQFNCVHCDKNAEGDNGTFSEGDGGFVYVCSNCQNKGTTPTTDLIKDRSVYGNYNTHVNQKINDIMRTGFAWSKLTDPQKTSLEMISLKVSRVLNGDPNDVDHWKDIAGYAELIVKELEK